MLLNIALWARPGILSLPGALPVPFWGLSDSPTAEPRLPGPILEAREGDTVEITLHNRLNEPVSLVFPGQDFNTGPVLDSDGRIVSMAAPAPPGGSALYTFTAARPGTFRYESGTDPEKQAIMGLYGAIVIRPSDFDPLDSARRSAYGAGSTTTYDLEEVLVLSELDGAASLAIATGDPYDPLAFSPRYRLINGRPFPDSAAPPDLSTQPLSARVHVLSAQTLLLRLLNCGFLTHTLALGGGPVRVIASDGWPLRSPTVDASYLKNSVTLGPGQTLDLLYKPEPGENYLYDRELVYLVNPGSEPGGMMSVIDVRSSFPALPPADPSNLTAATPGPGLVELNWQNNAPAGDGLVLERRAGLSGAFLRLAVLLGESESYQDETVRPDTSYTYRLKSFNAAGYSGYSNEAFVTVVQPLLGPTGLTAAALSGTGVSLVWNDNSTNEDGFRIERRVLGSTTFFEVGRTPPNIASYYDGGLLPETTYEYRVCAYRGELSSPYSNTVTVTTAGTPPAPPSNLVAERLPDRRIRLSWTDNSHNEEGFIIERRSYGFFRTFTEIARVGANETSYVDTTASPWWRYYYRIRSFNAWGVSEPSNTAAAPWF